MENPILPHLDNLGIYQLRMVGRQVGVELPTTLKKQELIDKIRAIVSGQEKSHVKKSNRGRPPKNLVPVDAFQDENDVDSVFIDLESYYSNSLADVAESEEEVATKEKIENASVLVGFVEVFKNDSAQLITIPQSSKSRVSVSAVLVRKHKIKTGDKVKVLATKEDISGEQILVAREVLSVNDVSPDKKIKSTNFANLKALDKTELIFENSKTEQGVERAIENLVPFYFGDRAMLSIEDKKSAPAVMYDMLFKLNNSKNVTNIIFVGKDLNHEFVDAVSSFEKVTVVGSLFGENAEYSKLMFEKGFSHARRLINIEGNNVVFVLQNLSEWCQVYGKGESAKLLEFCKKFFMNAKQTQDSSLTCVYAFIDEKDLEKEFESNENIFIKFLPYKYLTKTKIKFNILESYRLQIFNAKNNDALNFQNKVEQFLLDGNYIEKHGELESLIKQCNNVDDLLNKI